MKFTASNPKICLFCDKRGLTTKDTASSYLEGKLDVLDHRERCENGTDQEKQLYEFILKYRDDQLLRLRNSQWAPDIIRVLREERNSTIVFAFGAAHFRGEHRVQRYLEEAGFDVDYMTADEPYM